MSDLKFNEKRKLEEFFQMGGGYVLDFTNSTFQEFIKESIGVDIYDDQYKYESCSKANLLRGLWKTETNNIVGKLLKDLIFYAEDNAIVEANQNLIQRCKEAAGRLLQGACVEEIEALGDDISNEKTDKLVKSIRSCIYDNEPESALDRLHTLAVQVLRRACKNHEITDFENKPLHSLLGEYTKKLQQGGAFETEMTERILKSNISVLEAFNQVRNNHSFAHDNPILNKEESLLIVNNIVSCIKFIQAIERNFEKAKEIIVDEDDGLPF